MSIKKIAKQIYSSDKNKNHLAESTLYTRLLELNKKQHIKLTEMTSEEIDIFIQEHKKELFVKKDNKFTNLNKRKISSSKVNEKPLQNVKYPKQVYHLKGLADKIHNNLSLATIYQRYMKYGNYYAKILNKPVDKNIKSYYKVKTKHKIISLKKWFKKYYKHSHKNYNKKQFNECLLSLKLRIANSIKQNIIDQKELKKILKK